MEHRSNDMQFIDDSLMINLNAPKTFEDFCNGAADPRQHLTPYSRSCASLWRELYGSRHAHYNASATVAAAAKRKSNTGGFRKITLGVLASARLAVASERRRRARRAASLIHSDTGTADSAFWTDDMQKFKNRSSRNIPSVVQTRASPGGVFLNPPGVHLSAARSAKQPLARAASYTKVAILHGDMSAVKDARIVTGRHRCADADLVVVPDLAILHDVVALSARVDMAISFLYIVALGIDITTVAQLSASGGHVRRLPAVDCIRHAPACHVTKVYFAIDESLDNAHPEIRTALRRISRADKSKCTLSASGGVDPASGGVALRTLSDVMAWACSVRRVEVEAGPKVRTTAGIALPS